MCCNENVHQIQACSHQLLQQNVSIELEAVEKITYTRPD
jgi:hypothetical protein